MSKRNEFRLGQLLPGVVRALAAAQGKRVEDLLDEEERARMGSELLIESEAERLVWDAHKAAGLVELEGLVPQHPFWAYRIDFALPERRIGFEIDGHAFHSDALTFDRDRKRHRKIEFQGWRLVRFSGKEACADPVQVVREMALAARLFRCECGETGDAA